MRFYLFLVQLVTIHNCFYVFYKITNLEGNTSKGFLIVAAYMQYSCRMFFFIIQVFQLPLMMGIILRKRTVLSAVLITRILM